MRIFPTPALPAPPVMPEDRKRIRPDILVIALLDDLGIAMRESQAVLQRIASVLSLMEAQMEIVPRGVVEVFDDISVSGTQEQVFDTVGRTEQKWFSTTIYNAGDDSVDVRINDGLPSEPMQLREARRARWMTLEAGESMEVDFHRPLIERIYYRGTVAGTSATLKITGEW